MRGGAGAGPGAGADGAGSASGTGAVVAGAVAQALRIAMIASVPRNFLVVVIDAQSSSIGEPDCMVDTRPQRIKTPKVAANIPRSTYIPAMPWHDKLTFDSFLRARKLGAFDTL